MRKVRGVRSQKRGNGMMVMVTNSSSMMTGYLAGKYAGRIGWLLSPGGWRNPHRWLGYAIDNGAFPLFTKGQQWSDAPFYAHLDRTKGLTHKPLWIAVPDSVGNREETLRMWFAHSPRVAKYGCPLAFVVQDGMTPDDIPPNASVVFVGGTDAWKMRNVPIFTAAFPRVHVGRINGEKGLWECHNAGAESCDGTGWMRCGEERVAPLLRYLDESTNGRRQQELTL